MHLRIFEYFLYLLVVHLPFNIIDIIVHFFDVEIKPRRVIDLCTFQEFSQVLEIIYYGFCSFRRPVSLFEFFWTFWLNLGLELHVAHSFLDKDVFFLYFGLFGVFLGCLYILLFQLKIVLISDMVFELLYSVDLDLIQQNTQVVIFLCINFRRQVVKYKIKPKVIKWDQSPNLLIRHEFSRR